MDKIWKMVKLILINKHDTVNLIVMIYYGKYHENVISKIVII